MTESLSHCAELVRAADPDRFYAALFAPAGKREALFALLAFNHEIARVREVVSEGIMGEMRLAWWREVLDEIASGGAVRAHPIAQALAAAHSVSPFSLDLLRALIDARSFDLYTEPMADLAALEAYAVATGGGLHRAMAEVLLSDTSPLPLWGRARVGDWQRALSSVAIPPPNPLPEGGGIKRHAALGKGVGADANEDLMDIAEAAGTAWALTGIVRALRIHSARNQLYLPLNELSARGLPAEALFAGEISAPLRIVIDGVTRLAKSHLARASNQKLGAALPAILACALLPAQWRRIARRDFDPFRASSDPPKVTRMWLLLAAALRGRI